MAQYMKFLENNPLYGVKRQAAIAEGFAVFYDARGAGPGCDETQCRTPSCHPPMNHPPGLIPDRSVSQPHEAVDVWASKIEARCRTKETRDSTTRMCSHWAF